MDRRKFLAWIGGTAVGAAFAATADMERLLWVPGAKKIFLPTPTPIALFTVGDIFTIAGKYAVNPITGRLTPHLQRSVATGEINQGVKIIPIGRLFPYTDAIDVSRLTPKLTGYTAGWTTGSNS